MAGGYNLGLPLKSFKKIPVKIGITFNYFGLLDYNLLMQNPAEIGPHETLGFLGLHRGKMGLVEIKLDSLKHIKYL